MMTKKEQKRVDELLTIAALRSTSKVDPDVPIPSNGEPDTHGYLCNSYTLEVRHITSKSYTHNPFGSTGFGTQGGVALYSTKLLAIKAARYEVERRCANQLRAVDIRIENEENETPESK